VDRKQANYLLRRIYASLRREDVQVKFDSTDDTQLGGLTWNDDGTLCMELNPRCGVGKGGFISTILHECLHMVRADLPEKKILKMEEEMFAVLTDRQLGNLTKRVIEKIGKRAWHESKSNRIRPSSGLCIRITADGADEGTDPA
jgi:hypothetical protein